MFLLWPIQTNIEIYLKRSTLLYYSIFDKHCKNITVKVLMTQQLETQTHKLQSFLIDQSKNIEKQEKAIVKEVTDKVKFFIYVSWLVSLGHTYKDGSICIDQIFSGISFTYRTWLRVDGYSTLALLVLLILYYIPWCQGCKECFGKLWQSIEKITLILLSFFKVTWMIIGLIMFLNLDFPTCSGGLQTLGNIYFLTFTYFCIRALLIIFKTRQQKIRKQEYERLLKEQESLEIFNSTFEKIKEQKELKSGAKNRGFSEDILEEEEEQTQKKKKEEKVEEEKEWRKQLREKVKFFVCASWMVSLVLAYKDYSVCAQIEVFSNLNFTYQTWLWVDGSTTLAILVIMTFKYLIWCRSCVLLNCFPLSYSLITILTIFKLIWIFLGLAMFLGLQFHLCNDLLLNYGNAYYLTFLYFVFYVILRTLEKKKIETRFGKTEEEEEQTCCYSWLKFCAASAHMFGYDSYHLGEMKHFEELMLDQRKRRQKSKKYPEQSTQEIQIMKIKPNKPSSLPPVERQQEEPKKGMELSH